MRRLRPLTTALGLLLIAGLLIVRARVTPSPVPATADPQTFSAERALRHAPAMVARPHPSGSEEHARVRAYIADQLRQLGLTPTVQETTAAGTRYPSVGHIVNLVTRVPGRQAGGKAVLIAAHYDSVWAAPAAGDDGHAAMALLETLRALRAGPPLEHDVIALFSDAEEAGLLGAAAFVREHPWTRDVAVTLDFEARGTEGRSTMFETGAGNLDTVRVLQGVPDVTTSSLSVTIYRSLQNDTDLSELSQLGTPALNFAFVGGVSRYHTAHDDLAHLSPGSLQHVGNQMLALSRAFADGPLPRPTTGDAVFFDLPAVGIVAYRESLATPFSVGALLVALAALIAVIRRVPGGARSVALGSVGLMVATGVSAYTLFRLGPWLVAWHASHAWGGAPAWRGEYVTTLGFVALALALGVWAALRRWADPIALQAGALIPVAAAMVFAAMRLPGASYLLTWPVAAVSLALLVAVWAPDTVAQAAHWVSAAVVLSMLVPPAALAVGYTLPLEGPGAIVLGVVVPIVCWHLLPLLDSFAGSRWRLVGVVVLVAVATAGWAALQVRRSAAYPALLDVALYASPDHDGAWLTIPVRSGPDSGFEAAVLGPERRLLPTLAAAAPDERWIYEAGASAPAVAAPVARPDSDGPSVRIDADVVEGSVRRVRLHVVAPAGSLLVRLAGPEGVRATRVDGLTIDARRYRRQPRSFVLPFVAPPTGGFTVDLEMPAGRSTTLHVGAVTPGLALPAGRPLPTRPADVVPVQNGDVTVRDRQIELR